MCLLNPILQTEPFKLIAEKIAQEEKIDIDQVLLSRKDLDIKVDDTPQSIKFSVTDILGKLFLDIM